MCLERSRSECEEYYATLVQNKFELLNQDFGKDSIIPFATMPVTGNYYMNYTFNGDFGGCTISANANATYDAQYDNFMRVNSYNFRRSSGTNCTGWSNNGCVVNVTNGSLRVRFDGTADFRYRVPIINIEMDQTVPFLYGTSWSTSDIGKTINRYG